MLSKEHCFPSLWLVWWTSNCLDYQQSLFFLSPSNKTRENAHVRDWRRETGKAQKKRPWERLSFLLGLPPSFLASRGFDARRSLKRVANWRKKRDCMQSRNCWFSLSRRSKNQNRSINKVQNLGKDRRWICKAPRQDSGHSNFWVIFL